MLETCLGIIPGLIVGDVDDGDAAVVADPNSYELVSTGRSKQPTEDVPFTANRVIFCQILYLSFYNSASACLKFIFSQFEIQFSGDHCWIHD